MLICSSPGCQTTAGCVCDRVSRAPFMSMAHALANPDFQKWADQLLEKKTHSLSASTGYHWSVDARAIVRELLIEAIAIGATKFDALGVAHADR